MSSEIMEEGVEAMNARRGPARLEEGDGLMQASIVGIGVDEDPATSGSAEQHKSVDHRISKSVSNGVLVPLKTTLETKTRERTVEVYVTSVEPRQASNTLNLVRSLLPDDSGLDLQHLRRFAKYHDVPASVRLAFEAEKSKRGDQIHDEVAVHMNLFLVVGSINAISQTVLLDALSSVASNVVLWKTFVPVLAPTSPEQAARWTSQFWPTVYKKSNPFGPHPSVVSRAEEEIRGDVQQWIDLADEAAKQSEENGLGEAVGVVVVERRDGIARAVAVAGDARWHKWPRNTPGNVTAHAAMRAIAMVATELRAEGEARDGQTTNLFEESGTPATIESKGGPRQDPSTIATQELALETIRNGTEECADQESSNLIPEIFQDKPLSEIELQNLSPSGDGDGYLCHGLEIYCSHEPCVMCSMAIVHSRFGKIVFARRMEETGGMCADNDLGHGLFWRKELNWNMLAWQWDDSIRTHDGNDVLPHMHA